MQRLGEAVAYKLGNISSEILSESLVVFFCDVSK